MTTLYLHIGPMKTGSTWLQTAFVANAETLGTHNIAYPLVEDAGKAVNADQRVMTGNALTLLDAPEKFAAKLGQNIGNPARSVLFSSEVLFNRLSAADDLSFLCEGARAAGYDEIRILLFVRSPIPHVTSVWQQRVKGWQGETQSLDAFAQAGSDWPERTLKLVERLEKLPGVAATLRNYDSHRKDLLCPVEEWLGMPAQTLARPAAETLNRSLTRSEVTLQRALNRQLGPSGKIFAFRLVNRIPEVAADAPRPSAAVAHRLMERHRNALDLIDARLPASEPVDRSVTALPDPAPPLCFSEAQLEVIAEGLSDYVNPSLKDRFKRVMRRIRG